jgi:hypothetical protein
MAASSATARSVWSAKDEAALQELAARKQRIMELYRDRLENVLCQVLAVEDAHTALDSFIAVAETLRDALAPFDSRSN